MSTPIPEIRSDIEVLKQRSEPSKERLNAWEENIKLIPTIFEEVGKLRKALCS